jgi:hypothetical protein
VDVDFVVVEGGAEVEAGGGGVGSNETPDSRKVSTTAVHPFVIE